MPRQSALNHLPTPVHAELVSKILTNRQSNYQGITTWLEEQHGVKVSVMAVCRFAQKTLIRHYGLLDLGIPIDTIAANVKTFELLGAYLVQREVLNRRIDKLLASMMQDVDQPEAKP